MRPGRHGFTLIELLIVMAILGTLLALVAPRYFGSVDHSKEVALKQNLAVMRDAIDKYFADQNAYPESLEILVEKKYLKKIPVDPLTESAATWELVAPPAAQKAAGRVYDVRSGAPGHDRNGIAYREL